MYVIQMDLIVSMNQLTIIWVTLLLYALLPVLMIVGVLLTCVCTCLLCPCCIGYIVYEVLNGGDCNIFDAMAGWYFSFFEYLFEEGEPQISTKTVHPFKLRSPLSTSKYKSPESLAKIIEKTSPEVSSLCYS